MKAKTLTQILAGGIIGAGIIFCGCENGLDMQSSTGVAPKNGRYRFVEQREPDRCQHINYDSEGEMYFTDCECPKSSQDSREYDVYVAERRDTGQQFLVYKRTALPIVDGRFHNQFGEIHGTFCPSDGYEISGHFVSETRAEGEILRIVYCHEEGSYPFAAEKEQDNVFYYLNPKENGLYDMITETNSAAAEKQ